MKILTAFLTGLLLTGCDASISGESTHTVQGEATVKIVVGVDVTACEGLNVATLPASVASRDLSEACSSK